MTRRQITVPNLSAGSDYSLQVRGSDAQGNVGAWSLPITTSIEDYGGQKGVLWITIAAHNAPGIWKKKADYICTGVSDQIIINQAMTEADSKIGPNTSDSSAPISDPQSYGGISSFGILLSPGTYYIDAFILIEKPLAFCGAGVNATEIVYSTPTGANGERILGIGGGYNYGQGYSITNRFRLIVSGLTLNGNNAEFPDNGVDGIWNSSACIFRNINVINCDWGVFTWDLYGGNTVAYALYENCFIAYCNTYGMYANGPTVIRNSIFSNNLISLAAHTADTLIIEQCLFYDYDSSRHPIWWNIEVGNWTQFVIDSCMFATHTSASGYNIDGDAFIGSITNCYFTRGINVFFENGSITNNIFDECDLYLPDAANRTIINNNRFIGSVDFQASPLHTYTGFSALGEYSLTICNNTFEGITNASPIKIEADNGSLDLEVYGNNFDYYTFNSTFVAAIDVNTTKAHIREYDNVFDTEFTGLTSGTYTPVRMTASGFTCTTDGSGMILPNGGTRYKAYVDNSGNLTTVAL